MKEPLLTLLACPRCGGDLRLEEPEYEQDEILDGSLACGDCDARYPIVRGVPRLNADMQGLENVARTFGYEWKAHHAGKLEDDTLFGRTIDEDWQMYLAGLGVTQDAVHSAVTLDAGCGSGRFVRLAAVHGAALSVGLDINEAVDEAFRHCRDLPNAHIVQGNVFSPPFKPHAFDLVFCNGVLHHTPDPRRGHRALARVVAPGGRFYVWVYAKRFNPFRFVKDVFDALRITKLPEPILLHVAKALAYPSIAALQLYRALRRLPGLEAKSVWGLRTVRPRTVKEVQLTWFDALSPEFDSRHTEDEVTAWFAAGGFTEIGCIEEPKVGVRGTAPSGRAPSGRAPQE